MIKIVSESGTSDALTKIDFAASWGGSVVDNVYVVSTNGEGDKVNTQVYPDTPVTPPDPTPADGIEESDQFDLCGGDGSRSATQLNGDYIQLNGTTDNSFLKINGYDTDRGESWISADIKFAMSGSNDFYPLCLNVVCNDDVNGNMIAYKMEDNYHQMWNRSGGTWHLVWEDTNTYAFPHNVRLVATPTGGGSPSNFQLEVNGDVLHWAEKLTYTGEPIQLGCYSGGTPVGNHYKDYAGNLAYGYIG